MPRSSSPPRHQTLIQIVAHFSSRLSRYKPLLRRDVEACARSLNTVIAALKAKGHTSILAGLDSKELSHWTVITGVSRSTLRVLDSDGFHYLKLDGCRLDQRPRPKAIPRYWVRIYGGFVVTAAASHAKASAVSAA